MSELKCICCGKTAESESRITCPQCGYTMYETPYDRAYMLRQEIVRFVNTVSSLEMDMRLITWTDKAEDDKRFPDFAKIQAYCCTSAKTDTFLTRLKQSIDQIREYIHTPFQKTYKGDTASIITKSNT